MSGGLENEEVREKAHEKARESLKLRNEMINKKGRAVDKRFSGDARNPMDSIASFCSECITGYGDDCGGHRNVFRAISACESNGCHLWPWRGGRARPEDVIAERKEPVLGEGSEIRYLMP